MSSKKTTAFSRKIKERFFIEQMENILILNQFALNPTRQN
jgi:hypothetical protein